MHGSIRDYSANRRIAQELTENYLRDAMVHIDGLVEPVSAGSTLPIVAITMSLVSETARELVRCGHKLSVFVSPNVTSVPRDHNERVFEDYAKSLKR